MIKLQIEFCYFVIMMYSAISWQINEYMLAQLRKTSRRAWRQIGRPQERYMGTIYFYLGGVCDPKMEVEVRSYAQSCPDNGKRQRKIVVCRNCSVIIKTWTLTGKKEVVMQYKVEATECHRSFPLDYAIYYNGVLHGPALHIDCFVRLNYYSLGEHRRDFSWIAVSGLSCDRYERLAGVHVPNVLVESVTTTSE